MISRGLQSSLLDRGECRGQAVASLGEEEEEGGGGGGGGGGGYRDGEGLDMSVTEVGPTSEGPRAQSPGRARAFIESASLTVQTDVARPCPTATIRGTTAEKSPRPATTGRPPRREGRKTISPGRVPRAFVPTATASRTAELPPSLSRQGGVGLCANPRSPVRERARPTRTCT